MIPLAVTINGTVQKVDIDPQTPLLWVLRDSFNLTGTKFGCGLGLCGACTVHIDGVATRSCQASIAEVVGKSVTTIEGLAANSDHPVQQAWIAEQVPQCGYCQSGMIMTAAELLKKKPKPCARRNAHIINRSASAQNLFFSAQTLGGCV